jgi:hypothetical protein
MLHRNRLHSLAASDIVGDGCPTQVRAPKLSSNSQRRAIPRLTTSTQTATAMS